jgi:hypothetical protein
MSRSRNFAPRGIASAGAADWHATAGNRALHETNMSDKENALESELARAARHVASAKRIVAQQRERIAKLKARGHPVRHHEQLLNVFTRTLRALEYHERLISREIAEIRKGSDLPRR